MAPRTGRPGGSRGTVRCRVYQSPRDGRVRNCARAAIRDVGLGRWTLFGLVRGGPQRRSRDQRNLPVLLALIGIWNRNFLQAPTHAVLPYDEHLARLPAYLQQLEMESNGKSVRRGGERVESATCPVIWGEPGSNAQHSFYQLLHQGTGALSIDFLLPVLSGVNRQDQQDLASVNCLAQTWALATGDAIDSPAAPRGPHQRYPGNRPSSLLMFERLDPELLGKLVALYEHKVFVQGVIWDVNSFDQWGVQLGKTLASKLVGAVTDRGAFENTPIAGPLDALRHWRGSGT
jgi:glucose-6-phosphate isomerase